MIAPGKRADIVLLDDLETCAVVRRDRGRPPRRRRRCSLTRRASRRSASTASRPGRSRRTISASRGGADRHAGDRRHPRQDHHRAPDGSTLPCARRRAPVSISTEDVVKVAVVARHGMNRNIGRGFVKGFGLQPRRDRLVGRPRQPQHLRRRRRRRRHGRGRQPAYRASRADSLWSSDGEVRAELALPIAGLMSDQPFEAVRDALDPLRAAAKAPWASRWPSRSCRSPSCRCR